MAGLCREEQWITYGNVPSVEVLVPNQESRDANQIIKYKTLPKLKRFQSNLLWQVEEYTWKIYHQLVKKQTIKSVTNY